MAKNTIKLKKYSDVIEEFVAGAAITPGMLLELDSNGEVAPHSEADGNAIPMFALEDELQGKTIDDAYKAGAPVQVWVAGRGDIVNAIAGAEIAAGDFLVSDGTGKLKPVGSAVAVSVNITDTVTGANAALTDLNLDLTLVEGSTYTGTGTGDISASVSGTGTGTGTVAVHAHSIVGQALAAASSGGRVAVRII